ncbi:hypothetical protein VARIO8X_50055 [Burkholderiales bacterium 8X]|nr:hypothetical protein VARIO8X_50055 [Burkholderiales bacterium 8X]
MGRLGGTDRRRSGANARRAQSLERRQGPGVGAASAGAGVRGEVRPPARQPLSACDHFPAVALRQAAGGLPIRPAGGHAAVRAGAGFLAGQRLESGSGTARPSTGTLLAVASFG